MMAEYNRVLPRFSLARGEARARNEWCKVSIYERAKEAKHQWRKQMEADGIRDNGVSLYKTFYWHASSMHHVDIGGVIASLDEEMNAIMAPSWEHLGDALVAARSVLTLRFDVRRGGRSRYGRAHPDRPQWPQQD